MSLPSPLGLRVTCMKHRGTHWYAGLPKDMEGPGWQKHWTIAKRPSALPLHTSSVQHLHLHQPPLHHFFLQDNPPPPPLHLTPTSNTTLPFLLLNSASITNTDPLYLIIHSIPPPPLYHSLLSLQLHTPHPPTPAHSPSPSTLTTPNRPSTHSLSTR